LAFYFHRFHLDFKGEKESDARSINIASRIWQLHSGKHVPITNV